MGGSGTCVHDSMTACIAVALGREITVILSAQYIDSVWIKVSSWIL
jgi:hypothetical protein